MSISVKNLTQFSIDYYEIIKRNIIPDNIFIETVSGKRFPKWTCISNGMNYFALFHEFMIYKMISQITTDIEKLPFDEIKINAEKENVIEVAELIDNINNSDWETSINHLSKLSAHFANFDEERVDDNYKIKTSPKFFNLLKKHFNNTLCIFNTKNVYQKTKFYQKLKSFPDIIVPNYIVNKKEQHGAIFSIQTTANFVRQNIIKELLAHVAIFRKLNSKTPISFIGLILPVHQLILTYDVSSWDEKPYLNILLQSYLYDCSIEDLGTHIPKCQTLYQSVRAYFKSSCYQRVCQMFLQSPRASIYSNKTSLSDNDSKSIASPSYKYTKEDITKTKKFIQSQNILYFTHSPYIINLSRPFNSIKSQCGEKKSWCLELLKKELNITRKMGGKGVVVHVGKSKDMTKENAIETMKKSILEVLSSATQECPLILETPAGQKNELLSTIDEMIDFYQSFTDEQKSVFKICVDTCHIFASGYMPLDYLKYLSYVIGVDKIALIHFNDSAKDLACHVDRHEYMGDGAIGFVHLHNVGIWANEKNIPMVKE